MPRDSNAQRAIHIREDCAELTGYHKDATFYECTFRKLSGLVLENCDLSHSKFTTEDIKEALGLTVSLTCLSFNEVELSETLFDLLLLLLCKTKGNSLKRRQLLEVVGRKRAFELLSQMKTLE